MNWIKGTKGSIVNLDRIMSVMTDYSDDSKKYEVKGFYDCIHCTLLAEFETVEHAIDYVDSLFNGLREKRCTLETATSEPCSNSMDENTSSCVQMDSSQTLASRPNLPVAPERFIDSNGMQSQT